MFFPFPLRVGESGFDRQQRWDMDLDRSTHCVSLRGSHHLSGPKWLQAGVLAMFVASQFLVWILKWTISPRCSRTRLTVAESRREYVTAMKAFTTTPHPLAHPVCVCPPAVWCAGIVVVIAFKTGLGSGPRIFQLGSVKPITYLLREETQSCVDESLSVRANLCHLLWHHRIPSAEI